MCALMNFKGLILLVVAFLLFSLVNNTVFYGARLDLTANQLYTISAGTKSIIDELEQPIELELFFSDNLTKDIPGLRNYAQRVRELLEEYAIYSEGKIKLNLIDPEPFSEAEDKAAEYGLQGVPLSAGGEEIYFGLVARSGMADATIPFFALDKEQFLEYDISKIIYQLAHPELPRIGLLSGLNVEGGFDFSAGQPRQTPPWALIEEIKQIFAVVTLDAQDLQIDEDIDSLLIIHPKELPDASLYAIDQYLLAGGKALLFVDPLAETDSAGHGSPSGNSSNFDRLLHTWGISIDNTQVVGDAQAALVVNGPQGPARHLALLGLEKANMPADDIITTQLETLNMASAGFIQPWQPEPETDQASDDPSVEPAETEAAAEAAYKVPPPANPVSVQPLIQSSQAAAPIAASQLMFLSDPRQLARGFTPSGETYVMAARLSGPFNTAFPDGAPEILEASEEDDNAQQEGEESGEKAQGTPAREHLSQGDNLNLILVADTDLLTDRMWVRVQEFFGQRIATPWAENANFVINALDNLSGNADLISVRSRGRYSRPFTRVQDLQRQAEERFLESEQRLQQELQETEAKLTELQQHKDDQESLELSPEQEEALVQFQDEKLRIRKELREVRHNLNQDIESLGMHLKMINIAAVPILLTLITLVILATRRWKLTT